MRRTAFTLIELLIVVAIVALLLAILAPSLHAARDRARQTVCAARLHQVGVGLYNYWTEQGGRVPYIETPMTNGGFGLPPAVAPDPNLDPFDRQKWPSSLPNVLMPQHLGEQPELFVCPSAVNGWPRAANAPYRFTYRDAGANQPNGVVTPPGSYERESFGFLDGRMLAKLRIDIYENPSTPQEYIHNAQEFAKQRGTYLRDLLEFRQPGEPVVGPHRRGIMVLDRDLFVRYRSQPTAYEDLAPNGAGVRF
ncbi:MAG: type II secretion system GspH family protein [Phycisphaerae bacterium]|jgi:prepilin-type N-terminal cleavage/methylation domain-containing protein|nr:prepilin-type N-terminal cleavage/methylation domain-containing protein [Phycisphaerae bacterium]MCZ2398688.1 type II secretion system GspH family protein [Phycisphaerae bacterium]NUQ50352.1 prepilin-type N-terminal cleavage/methylation domain-containing protein [Phycisphaerae bacterium]